MEGKWTPGPWTVGIDSGQYFIADRDGELLATVCEWSAKLDKADAHLIAAAPDLYEAVMCLISCEEPHHVADAQKRAKTALAKARGEA